MPRFDWRLLTTIAAPGQGKTTRQSSTDGRHGLPNGLAGGSRRILGGRGWSGSTVAGGPTEFPGDFNGDFRCPALTSQLAFPCDQYAPARRFQLAGNPAVTSYVPLELLFPECRVGLGRGRDLAAVMPVPEASMHEYGGLVSWKDDVRLAWKPGVQPEAEAKGVKRLPECKLGSGVPAPDPGHSPGPFLRGEEIRHWGRGPAMDQAARATAIRVDSLPS